MKFFPKWQAVWMAVAFAEENNGETARVVYEQMRHRPEERVTERPRPSQRPRAYRA